MPLNGVKVVGNANSANYIFIYLSLDIHPNFAIIVTYSTTTDGWQYV